MNNFTLQACCMDMKCPNRIEWFYCTSHITKRYKFTIIDAAIYEMESSPQLMIWYLNINTISIFFFLLKERESFVIMSTLFLSLLVPLESKCTLRAKEQEVPIIPEISTSGNFVQVHQFLQEIGSAAPISEPHAQGQRGSTVAVNTNYQQKYVKIAKQKTNSENKYSNERFLSIGPRQEDNTIRSSNCRRYQARIVYSTLLQSLKNSVRSESCSAECRKNQGPVNNNRNSMLPKTSQ